MNKKLYWIAQTTWKQIKDAQLFLVASSLAYTTILSIIPLLALSFAIFEAFGGMKKLFDTIEPFILSNLAQGTSEEVITIIQSFVKNAHTSAVGVSGFIGLMITSMSMLSSIENAINRVWQTRNTRTWFQRFSTHWLFITLGPIAFAFALGIATSNEYPIAKLLPGGTGTFVLTATGFFCLYKFVPNCPVRWNHALISGVMTSVFWNFARLAYSVYTRRILSYHKIYGSLGAVPILLLWIYIAWIVVLAGAALTAALQKSDAILNDNFTPKTIG